MFWVLMASYVFWSCFQNVVTRKLKRTLWITMMLLIEPIWSIWLINRTKLIWFFYWNSLSKYHYVKIVEIWSFFSGPHFPAFGLNISPYWVWMWENAVQKKLRIWTLFKQCTLVSGKPYAVILSYYIFTINFNGTHHRLENICI